MQLAKSSTITMSLFGAGIYGPGRSALDSAMNEVAVLIYGASAHLHFQRTLQGSM